MQVMLTRCSVRGWATGEGATCDRREGWWDVRLAEQGLAHHACPNHPHFFWGRGTWRWLQHLRRTG